MVRIGGISAAAILVGLSVSQPSSAQQSVMSAAGYTGLSVTPTANLLPWGSLGVSYDNEIVGGPTAGKTYSKYGTSGHNVVVGFGLLPFLEISGRMSTNKIQTNCYTDNCGLRDLSFNFKSGIALDEDGRIKIAVGANDFGGNANFFRTLYGVATYSPSNFDLSAGYARKSMGLIGGTTPLDGFFGSVAYRPWGWLQTHIEYDAGNAWAGARVFAPSDWLPLGWGVSVGVNMRVHGDDKGARSWFNVGLSVPLYKVPETRYTRTERARVYSTDSVVSEPIPELPASAPIGVRTFSSLGLSESEPLTGTVQVATNSEPGLSSASPSVKIVAEVPDEVLDGLAFSLKEKGFEDIYVGRMPTGAIAIQINNATYNVNTADGLGVALGVVARHLGTYRAGYRLVLTQRQIAIVGVAGQADCLADWIAMKAPRCVAGTLHTPGTDQVASLVKGAQWKISGSSASWKTARFIFQPVLSTSVATEYGVLDYSAGIRSTIQQPLWQGAYLEWSHVSPVTETSDFKPNAVYGSDRIVNVTDKVLLHQVMRVPLEYLFGEGNAEMASRWGATALNAHIAAGRINSDYRGLYGELRWEPFEGRHRFSVEGGRFERMAAYDYYLPRESRSALASYRYSFAPTKTDFEVTLGQYLYNDRGGQFLITQWFDDVALNLYLRRTKYEYEKQSRTFAGVEIVIPLTPRKDMNPNYHVQVTGPARWAYGIETKVGGTNFISTSQGLFPGAAVLDRTFNADRASMAYFEDNMARIRSAASR